MTNEFFMWGFRLNRHCFDSQFAFDLRHNPTGKAFEEWELKALRSMW